MSDIPEVNPSMSPKDLRLGIAELLNRLIFESDFVDYFACLPMERENEVEVARWHLFWFHHSSYYDAPLQILYKLNRDISTFLAKSSYVAWSYKRSECGDDFRNRSWANLHSLAKEVEEACKQILATPDVFIVRKNLARISCLFDKYVNISEQIEHQLRDHTSDVALYRGFLQLIL